MPDVDITLSMQLVNASGLAYADGLPTIIGSKYFAGSKLINNPQLVQITDSERIDSVLVGQTVGGVVVSFRGTMPPNDADPSLAILAAEDWFNDADLVLTSVPYAAGKIHSGFAKSLDNLWEGLSSAFSSAYQNGDQIVITGHSKGGALAALATQRLAFENVIPPGAAPTNVITFGAARAGDENFATAYNTAIPNHWRFEHRNDVVPHLPPRPAVFAALKLIGNFPALSGLFKTITRPLPDYTSVGNLCFLDWSDKLDEDDTLLLEFEREARLIIAGEELVTDHFIDGYIAAMQSAFSTPGNAMAATPPTAVEAV